MSVVGGDRRVIVQAKGGIRDYKVTGVQTCALPIFHAGHHIFIIRKKYPHILQKTNIPTILPKAVLAIPSFIATRFDFQCMAITVYPMIIVIQSATVIHPHNTSPCIHSHPGIYLWPCLEVINQSNSFCIYVTVPVSVLNSTQSVPKTWFEPVV